MKPNEQLSWSLVAVSLLALPRWALGALLFLKSDVYLAGLDVWLVLLLILLAGSCSLLLLDLSQPLSAIFGLASAGFATTPLYLANFAPDRYPVELFFPAVLWLVAATYPDSSSVWLNRTAILVTSFSAALFVIVVVGGNPYVWPALLPDGVRNWEFIAVAGLSALILMAWRFRARRQRVNRGHMLFLAFAPAFGLISLDVLLRLGARVWGVPISLPDFLGSLTLVALGWGIFTLTRAELARHTEVRHEQPTRDSYRS